MSFWNPGFSIDFDAIVRFKLRHTSIAQLERRFNTPAHIRCDPRHIFHVVANLLIDNPVP